LTWINSAGWKKADDSERLSSAAASVSRLFGRVWQAVVFQFIELR
jgi:hypothetical protein